MKILITGATGFVGHQLALKLAEGRNDVNILVRNPNSVHIPIHKNIRAFTGDITEKQSITAIIKGCEQVYHTAALVKIFDKNPLLFHEINVEGTRNMLEKSLESGVKKFVFTSSCSVIGPSLKDPMREDDTRITTFDNNYDTTKFIAENLVIDYVNKGLTTVIVSPSKVFGPGIETHPISVNKVLNNFINGSITFIPKPGNLAANYCFIDDVVNGHILAMENGTGGEKYILGGENISFVDFFQTVRSLTGTKATLIQTPEFFIKIWAALQWIQYKTTNKEPYVTKEGIQQIFCNKIFSSDKAIRQLGYQITPLTEGLQQTIQFLKNKTHA